MIEQCNEPNTKNFRKYYKGEETKRYFQILLDNMAFNLYSINDINCEVYYDIKYEDK